MAPVMMVSLGLLVLLVAFANGANDNFKGVAALHGGGVLSYRAALAWGTLPTLAGSLAAPWLASGLLQSFSGAGVLGDDPSRLAGPLVAVSAGAALTLLLVTRMGLPVSTTHALAGALAGAALATGAGREAVAGSLGKVVLLPLLASPLVAMALAASLHAAGGRWGLRGRGRRHCVCAGTVAARLAAGPAGALPTLPVLAASNNERCEHLFAGRAVLWLDTAALARGVQIGAGAALGFARGLNDTPKIAALLVGAYALGLGTGGAAVGLAMAAGGLLAARRVARTLAFGITPLDPADSLAASLVAAVLVVAASPLALPVSTTHVACGALFGIGIARGEVLWGTVRTIAAAWLTTLPLAAVLAAAAGRLLA